MIRITTDSFESVNSKSRLAEMNSRVQWGSFSRLKFNYAWNSNIHSIDEMNIPRPMGVHSRSLVGITEAMNAATTTASRKKFK